MTLTKGSSVLSTYVLRDTHSGQPKEKSFCKTCGCTIWTEPGAAKGKFYFVRASLFDGVLVNKLTLSHTLRPKQAHADDT